MPDDDVPATDPIDVEGDGDDHEVPADLTAIHEGIDYTERAALGPNES